MNRVLAIETSCDDTSVAVVNSAGEVLALNSQSQDDVHGPFGGIIPELACRNHTSRLIPLVEKTILDSGYNWDEIDGIAVTSHPGLLGSLLVGVTTAKSLAFLNSKPLIGINHLEGHLHAGFLKSKGYQPSSDSPYPFVGLCVSGGHTATYHVRKFGKYEILGKTIDDAAGEAFDKFGKILGFGYPAGAQIDRLAKIGNALAYDFPRPLLRPKTSLDFSFSGLKTAGSQLVQRLQLSESVKADLCASYQKAIVDVLITKLQRAVEKTEVKSVVITGGVACNSALRKEAQEWAAKSKVQLFIPPPQFCTDNAAMIGLVGIKRLLLGEKSDLKLSPQAFMKVGTIRGL